MRDNDVHLCDQELLLYADGELSQNKAARMREHLAACWTCRSRSLELEGAIASFVQLHRSRLDALSPRADGLRSSLKAQLAAARKTPRYRLLPGAFWQQAACAAIALALLAAGVWRIYRDSFRTVHSIDNVALASALPNRSLTPGYTRPVMLSELCSRRQSNAPPNEDISIEQRVFHEYGLPFSTTSYELDYLITPDLGGADDVRNLWPEPYGSTDWNAHVKDELEGRLHTMVCDGQIDLATAQRDIATDWIAAYKRYFHTETPLSNARDGSMSRLKSDAASNRRLPIVLSAGRFEFRPIW
jgi:hypothetical protein